MPRVKGLPINCAARNAVWVYPRVTEPRFPRAPAIVETARSYQMPVIPSLPDGADVAVWRRAFRYRAEREATANALRAREGKPIETGSRCGGGGWAFDGTTLRFSGEIATATPDRPMPLVLRVKP